MGEKFDGLELTEDFIQEQLDSYTKTLNNMKKLGIMRDATQEEQQHIKECIDKISKPTGFNFYDYSETEQSPCDCCSNNPKNGGSGICHCTLGQKVFY